MDLDAEDMVTKLLSQDEIVQRENFKISIDESFNLGNFLKENKSKHSLYEDKYIFIK